MVTVRADRQRARRRDLTIITLDPHAADGDLDGARQARNRHHPGWPVAFIAGVTSVHVARATRTQRAGHTPRWAR